MEKKWPRANQRTSGRWNFVKRLDHATNAAMTAWYLTDWVTTWFSDIRTRGERGCSVLRKHRSRQQTFRLKWSGILICCATAHRGNERPSKSYRINIHYKPLGYRSAAYADDPRSQCWSKTSTGSVLKIFD